MYKLLLPVFIFRLIILFFIFIFNLILDFLNIKIYFVLSLILFVLYLFFLIQNFNLPGKSQNQIFININNKNKISDINQSKLDPIRLKLEDFLKINDSQQSLLINLSLINYYQNNLKNSQQLWEKAKSLDPNSPLFTEIDLKF